MRTHAHRGSWWYNNVSDDFICIGILVRICFHHKIVNLWSALPPRTLTCAQQVMFCTASIVKSLAKTSTKKTEFYSLLHMYLLHQLPDAASAVHYAGNHLQQPQMQWSILCDNSWMVQLLCLLVLEKSVVAVDWKVWGACTFEQTSFFFLVTMDIMDIIIKKASNSTKLSCHNNKRYNTFARSFDITDISPPFSTAYR